MVIGPKAPAFSVEATVRSLVMLVAFVRNGLPRSACFQICVSNAAVLNLICINRAKCHQVISNTDRVTSAADAWLAVILKMSEAFITIF